MVQHSQKPMPRYGDLVQWEIGNVSVQEISLKEF